MNMNLGINLLELDGKATPSIQGASTSVAGFIVRSQRGVPGRPQLVTSFAEFRDKFGDLIDSAYGAYAVRGFFDNGGTLAYVTRVVATGTGGAAAASNSFMSAAADGGTSKSVLTIKAGYRGREDPGAWGKRLSIGITVNTAVPNDPAKNTFNLAVQLDGKQVELWDGLKVGGVGRQNPNRINDETSGSRYIILQVVPDATENPAPTVGSHDKPSFLALEGDGKDDNLDTAANNEARVAALKKAVEVGNGAFDGFDIQLLACPETHDADFVNAALTYCSDRGDCMFIGHTPEDFDADVAANPDPKTGYGSKFRGKNVYGALYFPFIQVSTPSGDTRWIPPTGHVLGVYARTERDRGIWKAPAGNAARLNNVLQLKYSLTDTKHTLLVKQGGINAVRFISGQGLVIDSSRTLSTDPLWTFVNVRLLFNYVKSSLKTGLRWVVQEPNDPSLWNNVKYNSITPFLMGLWRRGAFGPGAPDEVFKVKVDAENNTPQDIQQGIFTAEVYFYPSRPAETIIIKVGQQDGSSAASEK